MRILVSGVSFSFSVSFKVVTGFSPHKGSQDLSKELRIWLISSVDLKDNQFENWLQNAI